MRNGPNHRRLALVALVFLGVYGCKDPSADPSTESGKSSNANLESLSLSSGKLVPSFSPDVTAYSATVDNSVDSIVVTGVAADKTARVSANSGVSQALLEGSNTLEIAVTAEDGSTVKIYSVSVYRKKSASDRSNADLSALGINEGTLQPAFSPAITAYTVIVGKKTVSATVTGTCANSSATLGGDNGKVVFLSYGENSFSIPVTSPDASTVKTYTVTVKRTNDVTAPKLTGFTLSPTEIDTTTGDKIVSGTVTAEDESGIYAVNISFEGPETSRYANVTKRAGESTATKAVYDWTVTIRKGSEGGTWYVDSLSLQDMADNYYSFSNYELSQYQTTFRDNAPVLEKNPPTLTGFSLSPTEIDTTTGDQTVSGTVSAEDDTGMRSLFVSFEGPEQGRYASVTKRAGESTATKCVYDWTVTIEKGSRGGTWYVDSISMYDTNDNYRYYSVSSLSAYVTSFRDIAPVGDRVSPTLTGFTLSPTEIDTTTGDQTVSGTVTAEDGGGVLSVFVSFTGPGTDAYAILTKRAGDSTPTKSIYDWTLTVKQGTRGGTWYVDSISMYDLKENYSYFSGGALSKYTTTFKDNAPSD